MAYRYWAFISYSSKDDDVSRKLHRKLETYRIPKALVGRPGRDEPVPKRIFPVFRDRDELPLSSDLGTSIEDALKTSRYLIVLCSPDAAESGGQNLTSSMSAPVDDTNGPSLRWWTHSTTWM